MLGFQEVILIFAILLLVLGPSKLPEMARAIGKAVREFNKASRGLAEAIESPIEVSKSKAAPSAVKKPISDTKETPIKYGRRKISMENKKEETPAENVKGE
ncbi:MAG: twin-arginine translocase TatA/TatE family subunit [Candidatus Heimdallarchaeota archaeon]